MPLPLLPGLVKNAADENDEDLHTEQPSGLAQFLDGLEDSDIQELVSTADQYHADNPDPLEDAAPAEGEESADDAAGDTDPAPPPGDDDEAAPGDESASTEPPGAGEDDQEADGSGSIDAIDAQLDEDIANAANVLSQMQDLADGDSESAPDVAKLVKQASGLSDKMDKQRKLLDKAIKAEDPQAAAQAGMDAQDSLTAMEKLLEAAQALGAKTEAPAMTDKDHPAIKAWSDKVQGKKLGIAPGAVAQKSAFGGK